MKKRTELLRKQTRAMREFSILYSSLSPAQAKVADKIFEKMDLVSEGLKQPEVQRMTKKDKTSFFIIITGLVLLALFANMPAH